jgi:hypothetical protein
MQFALAFNPYFIGAKLSFRRWYFVSVGAFVTLISFSTIKVQEFAERAVEVAAASRHEVLALSP